ncbi:MAG: hypothetical protein LBP32_00905 [Spirochaetaceae bacterium]|jgi:hypothetical protein|nr:hypothetical protein [Spirochaetaceae bacterium]
MRRYLMIAGLTAVSLIILGITGSLLFEVYPVSRYVPPSREALENEYLALDRWLTQTGHPVRIENRGNAAGLRGAAEKTALIGTSFFDWSRGTAAELEAWVRGGCSLVVSLDGSWDQEELALFFDTLGVRAVYGDLPGYHGDSGEENGEGDGNEPVAFDRAAAFFPDTPELFPGSVILRDRNGLVRLLTIPLGEGSVTLTGVPCFMRSLHIGERQNALLSWDLTGARDPENRGILFIRGERRHTLGAGETEPGEPEREPGFFEKLARRGGITALLVSILFLTVVGFWMVIPRFGILERDDPGAGKPIRERFLAEARFLKKYRSLGSYLEVYIRELKAKLRREGIDGEEDLARRIVERCRERGDQTTVPAPGLVQRALCPGTPLRYRDFVRYREILAEILERL